MPTDNDSDLLDSPTPKDDGFLAPKAPEPWIASTKRGRKPKNTDEQTINQSGKNLMSENKPDEFVKQNIPPVKWKRNQYGLLEHIDYIFNEDGSVNWRKMIESKNLVPNKTKTEETDITKLTDKDLLVLLAGYKDVASLRGYTNVSQEVISSFRDYVCIKTTICWIPNYETNGEAVCFSGVADAHPDSTTGVYQKVLSTIAENRSFVRAVRNFLRIHIVGADELNLGIAGVPEAPEATNDTKQPIDFLTELLKQHNISFQQFKNRMQKEEVEGVEDWNEFSDIPQGKIFNCLEKVKQRIAEKKKKSNEEA